MVILKKQSKPDHDVIVIGAGILGATIYTVMSNQGRRGLLLDDERPLSGTKPSGGHLKPSWFGDLKKTDYEPAMETLDQIWGLHQSDFVVWPTKIKTTVYRVDTDVVMKTAKTLKTVGTVDSITPQQSYPLVTYTTPDGASTVTNTKLLIVAAGAWCDTLLPGLKISPKRGVSFRYAGKLPQEFIKPWAPFKQVVAHQQGPNEIWVGDGSAILSKNWTDDRTKQCQARCLGAIGGSNLLLKTFTGVRPYCESGKDPCLLKQVTPGVWVVTGAGKSGTIAAGWAARKLVDATN